MVNLLKKKRKRDNMKITKNLFGFIRKKLFKNEKPLILTEDIYKKVIEQLKTNSYYKDKKILIEYIFITKFSECNELLKSKSNFLGLVFYKSLIILLNSKFEKFIKIINIDKNSKQDYFHEITSLMFIAQNDSKQEKITTSHELDKLMNYNLLKPSSLFVFLIYEINDK